MLKNRSLQVVLFFIILSTGIFLRAYHIGTYSLFSDERSSILLGVANINQGGMGDLMDPSKTFTPADFWADRGIKAWLAADAGGDVSGNSLVHDMMLKLFAFLFGKSDESMRSVSLLFNVLTIWVMYIWSRKIPSLRNYSFLIFGLAAIEPFFVIYSQQARNYATSLFFTTASNYFFWQIAQKENFLHPSYRKKWIFWILASVGALFSTYLTALVLVGQFVFLLIQKSTLRMWGQMVLGMGIIIFPLACWMVWGPGKYFMQFQADAAEQLLSFIKANGEIPGWLEYASPQNLFKRTISIISDQFIWTNDIYNKYGYKMGAIALLIYLYFIVQWTFKKNFEENKIFVFGLIQILLPISFLFLAAVNAGTTSGFFLRYASFGLPFGIFISVGFFAHQLTHGIWTKLIVGIFLFIQTYFLLQVLLQFYQDKPQKYTFSHDRTPNPYIIIANSIKGKYSKGDTVVYPSSMSNFLNSKHMRNRVIDPVDAQNVNLYFDEKDQFIQRVDPFIRDSVLIYKPNGSKILIFDFQKGKYRY